MEQHELAYIIRMKVWQDTPKVRADIEERLRKICELNFHRAEVEDGNDMGCV